METLELWGGGGGWGHGWTSILRHVTVLCYPTLENHIFNGYIVTVTVLFPSSPLAIPLHCRVLPLIPELVSDLHSLLWIHYFHPGPLFFHTSKICVLRFNGVPPSDSQFLFFSPFSPCDLPSVCFSQFSVYFHHFHTCSI